MKILYSATLYKLRALAKARATSCNGSYTNLRRDLSGLPIIQSMVSLRIYPYQKPSPKFQRYFSKCCISTYFPSIIKNSINRSGSSPITSKVFAHVPSPKARRYHNKKYAQLFAYNFAVQITFRSPVFERDEHPNLLLMRN